MDADRAGERIGVIYAVNVAGAVAGSLLTGFVLLPTIGSRLSLLLTSALALATGAAAARAASAPASGARSSGAGSGRRVRLHRLECAGPGDQASALAVSRARPRCGGRKTATRRSRSFAATLAFSAASPRSVHQRHAPGERQPSMVDYHRLIGTLPWQCIRIPAGRSSSARAAARPPARSPRSAIDARRRRRALARPSSKRPAGSAESIRICCTRPNVRLRVDDGRNYMLLTPERYDVVTADVILPVHAGAGNLYSVEYYRLMRRVLQQSRHRAAVDRQHRRDGIQADHADVRHGVPAHDAVAGRKPDGRIEPSAGARRGGVPQKAAISASRGRRSMRWGSRASRRCSRATPPAPPN